MPNVYFLACLELSGYSPTFALFFMVLDLRLVKDWLSRDNQFFFDLTQRTMTGKLYAPHRFGL